MQLDLFDTSYRDKILNDLFTAYYDARRNKRNTHNALRFELNYERNLFRLSEEITSRKYTISPSICFINFSPVQREIFAADFRDRIIHHFLFNYISPVFEKSFIYDSYSCRKGKGTHFGIKRLDHFIRSCSENYRRDCHILKLDIKGYFMAIDRNLLFEKIRNHFVMNSFKYDFDLPLVMYLLEKVIFNDPTKNCIIKGKKSDRNGLPPTKRLFFAGANKGLPIGNLTSQLFGNIYLNDFDKYIKVEKNCRYYGRYVDDFVIVHRDKFFLRSLIPEFREYLASKLCLELHPDKIYLQHCSKGVKFLGVVIKPHRIYSQNRTLRHFSIAMTQQNKFARDHKPSKVEQMAFISIMNSYLGILKHYKTYRYRKRMIKDKLSGFWENIFYARDYSCFIHKKRCCYKMKTYGLKPKKS